MHQSACCSQEHISDLLISHKPVSYKYKDGNIQCPDEDESSSRNFEGKHTLAPFAALIITYGTRSPTEGAVAASLYT